MASSLKLAYSGGGVNNNIFGRNMSFAADPSTEVGGRAAVGKYIVPIVGSEDNIVMPDPADHVGATTTDGYRRVDPKNSGGASEWLVDWNAVAAFDGGFTATDGNTPDWLGCQIKGTHLYVLFKDFYSAINANKYFYILKVNLTTGAIVSLTPITGVGGIVNSGTITTTNIQGSFWYMDDSEQFTLYVDGNSGFWETDSLSIPNAEAEKGFGRAVWSQDGTTVVSSNFYFDTAIRDTPITNAVSYVSADGNIVYCTSSGSIVPATLFAINENIRITIDNVYINDVNVYSIFRSLGTNSTSAANISFNALVGSNTVCMNRGTGSVKTEILINPFVDRTSLDDNLKLFIFKATGESV